MPYANYADKLSGSVRNYEANKDRYKDKARLHRDANPKLHAYWGQRHTSKQRGVEFNLTFDEWVNWWGEDFPVRGRRRSELQMCRYDDVGAYELGNIYKATQEENDMGPREKDEGLHEDIPY